MENPPARGQQLGLARRGADCPGGAASRPGSTPGSSAGRSGAPGPPRAGRPRTAARPARHHAPHARTAARPARPHAPHAPHRRRPRPVAGPAPPQAPPPGPAPQRPVGRSGRSGSGRLLKRGRLFFFKGSHTVPPRTEQKELASQFRFLQVGRQRLPGVPQPGIGGGVLRCSPSRETR